MMLSSISRLPMPAPRPLRILVVEDNVDSAETLAVALRLEGHAVDVAYDGDQAVAKAETMCPEVVLLDIGLPRRSGYRVAEALRAMPGLGDAFIVAVTAFGDDDDRFRAREAGFDLHLTKPVEFAELDRILAARAR